MPDLGISEILTIIGIAASAATTGVGLYESSQQQDAMKNQQKLAREQAAQQQLLQKREALTAAGPNAQAQTGGSLTGPAGQSFVDVLAGLPGGTGSGSPTTPAATIGASSQSSPYSPGGGDALTQFMQSQQQSSPFSGGWQPGQPSSQNRFQLTDFLT